MINSKYLRDRRRMELAIDTSLNTVGLALCKEGEVMVELSWNSHQNQSVELLPNLELLLQRAGAVIRDIALVMVALGPGGFNGVRVGLATAKGLSLGLGVPMVGVSTLEAMAFPLRGIGLTLCPVIPAGRGRLAAALFRASHGEWRRLKAEHLTAPKELASTLPRRAVICGRPPREALEAHGRVPVAPPLSPASGVAALGWERYQRGRVDNPSRLRPLYLKPPSIT
ncbi:MAG: tRNA (adenosine(37)-N6)-threonylcarbamoyltransferase complex dimerization subunit type 1 TsaB, partial [Dehalococcoidia bacterium]|nr:tRNA (adenosine(37)-N6)-threonylcarbamoyltransferase complex dimerization subunit type 1 TsaB [Dehalococcoidia bacterium]